MDAPKASYSITLMAKVLGVTRAGYDAWKRRATQRAQRSVVGRCLDEAVAWEHEVSGGTYGAPRIQCALTRVGMDVGGRAVAASMRRQGRTGLNTHPRPARRGGRGLVVHEDHCAHQWDQGSSDRVWITDFTYLRCAQGWVYPCAVRDAHSHLDRSLLQPPPHPHQPRRQISHRIRTTPSGLDNSRINKPSTTCPQTQGQGDHTDHHMERNSHKPLHRRNTKHGRCC